MTALRPELPIPEGRLASLPIDKRGYPVPWFVVNIDGEPDHRVIDGPKISKAWVDSLCWVCGAPLGGVYVTFTIGPMCAVNRVSAEPPSHRDCALYSVHACPFLSRPHAKRRESGLPEEAVEPDGTMIRRNPGVILVWTTRRVDCGPFAIPGGGVLFNVGKPHEVQWFCEGRDATRAEVLASIESGIPNLQKVADEDGPEAQDALMGMYESALELLPAA